MIQTIHLINVTKKKKKILVIANIELDTLQKVKKIFKRRSKRFFQKH